MGLELVALLVPGFGQPVLEVLKLIYTAVDGMQESNNLCRRVYEELQFIYTKIQSMEQKRTLPTDNFVHQFLRLVGDYAAFLARHCDKAWIYRVVMYKRVLVKVADIQADVALLLRSLLLCHIDVMADEVANMQQFRDEQRAFRDEQQRLIEAHLTDDRTVARAMVHREKQIEALSVFNHELKSAGRSETAAERQVVRTALNKVIRFSTVQVESVPAWFLPPHKIEYASQAFARGSFGSIHQGKMFGDVDVVVKCLASVDVNAGEHTSAKFRREASLWYSLRHKHVLEMYGACDVSTPPFIVCELAANSNLCNFLSFECNRPFTLQLLHEAASGLLYLHEHRVVHADLKCDNILVTADGTAKVADFSFSYIRTLSASKASIDATSGKKKKAGAVRWRAPECLNGRSPTSRSDVYSFGMCILEAVSQEVPWSYTDDETVRDQVKQGKLPDKPNNMTDRVWALVQRMCRLEATERPALERVVEALSELAQDEAATRGCVSMFDVSSDVRPALSPVLAYEFVATSDGAANKNVSYPFTAPDKATPCQASTQLGSAILPPPSYTAAVAAAAATVSTAASPTTAVPKYPLVPAPISSSFRLERAIARDDVSSIEHLLPSAYLLEKSMDAWGSTPLIRAAAAGAINVTRHLLSRSADTSATTLLDKPLHGLMDRCCTALHVAAHYGHASIARALLAAQPDLIARLTAGRRSALFFAVQAGHTSMVRELLTSGADPLCDCATGATAIDVAIEHKQDACVRLLCEINSEASSTANSGVRRSSVCMDKHSADSSPPLHIAVAKRRASVVHALLKNNADPNATAADGATALHYAAEQGDVEIVTNLLCYGARVNELNQSGAAPLVIAATHGHVDTVRMLLEYSANMHAKDHSGASALHYAASHGHVEVVTELLRCGARVDEPSSNGNTPLLWAAWKGQDKAARVLLAYSADVNATNNDNASALHRAVAQGHRAFVDLLLEAGATVDREAVKVSQRRSDSDLLELLKPKAQTPFSRLLKKASW